MLGVWGHAPLDFLNGVNLAHSEYSKNALINLKTNNFKDNFPK